MDLFQPASGTPSSDGVDPEAASEADSDVGNAPGILSHASDPLSGLTQGQLPATEEPAGGAALDAPTETDAPNPPPADPSARHRGVCNYMYATTREGGWMDVRDEMFGS